MVSSLVKWTKERLLHHLLGRVNERFLEFFVDLPKSFSFGGFMDRVELDDVCLDTIFISREFYKHGVPVRLIYGHIGTLKLNVSIIRMLHMHVGKCR